jgi:undecaprenyl-diphosphatase
MSVPPDGQLMVTRAPAARPGRGPIAGIVLCAAVVALLGAGVRTDFGPQLRLDAAVSEALYAGDDRAAALNDLLQVLTAPGLTVFRLVVFLPVLFLLVRRGAMRAVLWVTVAIVLIGPLTTLLKDLFGRLRPAFEGGGARYDSLSFPSGHSSGIATLVTAALILAWPLLTTAGRRLALAAGAALILLIGLTRMWLGVHFFSDVVAGWALGIGWTLLVAALAGGLPAGRAALPPRA